MKHTLIIGIAAFALSACTCTCPDKQYDLQYVQPNYQTIQTSYQPSAYQVEFLPPSHMMEYNQATQPDKQTTIQYRRYTQIKYTQPQEQYSYQYQQPQQDEIIYYPVYQPMTTQNYSKNCDCQQYNPCGC